MIPEDGFYSESNNFYFFAPLDRPCFDLVEGFGLNAGRNRKPAKPEKLLLYGFAGIRVSKSKKSMQKA
jgi:hypothetical protein